MAQDQKRTLGYTMQLVTLAAFLLAVAGPLLQGCNTSAPPNRQLNDVQITTQVKSKLASEVRASTLTNIDVNTTNGVVTLAGQVENADVKHSAESVAAAVPGVTHVNNNLQVAPASPPANH